MARAHSILFIDDDPGITEIVREYFASAGYKVDVENSPMEGLTKAKKNKPDVVLLDIVMPEMDGIEICSNLKKDPKYADIPIILLTGNDAKYEVTETYKSGCDLLVKKPFSCERLLSMVNTIINCNNK
jgi:CheY-like chemotaxis protein